MTRSVVVGASLVAAALLMCLSGCGGGGAVGSPPNGPPPVGGGAGTINLGPLSGSAESAANLRTLALGSPGASAIEFTVFYGTAITRLQERGFGRIAFSSYRDGNSEIYVMDADGARWTNLTNNPAIDVAPSWSPDGSQIAFSSNRTGNYDVHVMNADGSSPTRLTVGSSLDDQPSWSPDGSRIAFHSRRDGNYEIYVMDAEGSGQTNLTRHSGADYSPSWSPDGSRIAFVCTRDGNYEIYAMDADGSRQTNLTRHEGTDTDVSWSPDGSTLAFQSSRTGDGEIYSMTPSGSGLARLTAQDGTDTSPAWSPDGSRIALQSHRSGDGEIWVMNARGKSLLNWTKNAFYDGSPSWCPLKSRLRALIGPKGSDLGKNPPFGTRRPLVIVGLSDRGLVSATSVGVPQAQWPSVRVKALRNIGTELAGVSITAPKFLNVQEDVGRGLPARLWDVSSAPEPCFLLVFLSGATGKVASVIASTDQPTTSTERTQAVDIPGGPLVLTGEFTAAWDASDLGREVLDAPAHRIELDPRTGEVLRAS